MTTKTARLAAATPPTPPAVAVAREHADLSASEIRVLSTGVRARIKPVAASLIDEVTTRIDDPPIPTWFNPEKEREEENPHDPAYRRALQRVEHQRATAATDAMIMFGVELLDPIPDNGWDVRLKLLGVEIDLSDSIAREFAYKKYIAVGTDDLIMVSARTGLTQADIDRAVRSFQDNT